MEGVDPRHVPKGVELTQDESMSRQNEDRKKPRLKIEICGTRPRWHSIKIQA